MVLLVIGLLCLHSLGVYIFNQPYDPSKKLLPEIYFSANWHWFPGEEVSKLKPRREVWGGLLLALVMVASGCGFGGRPIGVCAWPYAA